MSDSETRTEAQVPRSKRIVVVAILGDDIAVVGQYPLHHQARAKRDQMRAAHPDIVFTTCSGNATYGRAKLASYLEKREAEAAKSAPKPSTAFEVVRVKRRAFTGVMA